jgi:DNA (cytosine-5)-methyltransferase 1
VFVVASARADFDPASVLFEFDGVRRDTAPSRETGQRVAPCVTNGHPFSRTGNERVEAEAMIVSRSHWDGDYPHPTLNQSAKGSGGVGSSNQEIFSQRGAYLAPQPIAARMVAFGEYSVDGTASAMKARDYKDATDLVAQPITYGIRTANTSSNGWGIQEEVTHTLDCAQGVAVAQPVVAMRESGLGYWMEDTVAGTLDANMGMSGHANRPAVMTVPQAMAVRRLTPVECERLQGFPDNYTNIPWRKKDESPDGPRYKALGNSWAVPVVRWIGRRIQEQINAA